jgi:hypothetical protein
VIETPAGPMLACQAAPGELIGGLSPAERADPASACQRFASLPVAAQLPVFDTLIDLHRVLAGLGWVACDLYDGCLIVDFSTLRPCTSSTLTPTVAGQAATTRAGCSAPAGSWPPRNSSSARH